MLDTSWISQLYKYKKRLESSCILWWRGWGQMTFYTVILRGSKAGHSPQVSGNTTLRHSEHRWRLALNSRSIRHYRIIRPFSHSFNLPAWDEEKQTDGQQNGEMVKIQTARAELQSRTRAEKMAFHRRWWLVIKRKNNNNYMTEQKTWLSLNTPWQDWL